MRQSGQHLFDATMLIAVLDLQMEDFFPCALKSKMPRFNNASMYRANSDFMDRLAINLKVGIVTRDVYVVVIVKYVLFAGIVFMVANHLQPGMSVRFEAELFSNLSLEHMEFFAD